ncbi:hypothetical protein SISNIDRAFT_468355 [Sistotremastrum niveocremeum HHB9708]|uniref:Uncharacterized protein n=1 Tax=Sistotremastrum niveocremeum HHB9708 TaxID=1314777 RepID=A0A164RHP4_9AGAM|nr:hypothetical protein SISNIDRAFT_468355 [Sistotremastrum niveocremeum HHB9708]
MNLRKHQVGEKYQTSVAVRARSYLCSSTRPSSGMVLVAMSKRGPSSAFAIPETLLGRQSSVRQCLVSVVDHAEAVVRYIIFYTHRPSYPANTAVRKLNRFLEWRGSLVVMRLGVSDSLVNIRGSDRKNADIVVEQFVLLTEGGEKLFKDMHLDFAYDI